MKLGLGVGLSSVKDVCDELARENPVLKDLSFLSLGFRQSDVIDPLIPSLTRSAGIEVAIHAIELNVTDEIDQNILTLLRSNADKLDAKWIEQDIGMWMWGNMYLGGHLLNPIENFDWAEIIARNVTKCKNSTDRQFLLENPPVYFRTGDCSLWDLLECAAEQTGAGIVFDVGHAIGYAINTQSKDLLPSSNWGGWQFVKELHFSGFDIINVRGHKLWMDKHQLPFSAELLEVGRKVIELLGPEIPICLELDGASVSTRDMNIEAIREVVMSVDGG